MDVARPFKLGGLCYALLASNAAPTGATFIAQTAGGDCTWLAYNSGANDAVLATAMSSGAAVTGATFPIVGTPIAVTPLPGKTVQSFTFSGQGMFAAAITQAGNSLIFIAPGDGE